ncbi:MAG: hypothetical protein JNJ49_11670 [Bdellovibrionaceae bacterium]|nr:hypothetical protein [Pseudobdellovibrionaceae bacterium]
MISRDDSVSEQDATTPHDAAGGLVLDTTASRKQMAILDRIVEFASGSSGLETEHREAVLVIRQRMDGHRIEVPAARLQDILMRTDTDGRDFVQVNFEDGTKILITDRLIGFKPVLRTVPAGTAAPSLSKLPKVVTTPDIMSVIEAIEDAVDSDEKDLPLLKDLFEAIIRGAETVGFDVARERALILPYIAIGVGFRASA